MYFCGKEKRDSGNWWKTCGLRDSLEKGAGMRDQDRPFQTLVGILFHLFINSARFRKKCFGFFSFVVRFRLVIRFYSHFFGLLVRCFPQQKRLYSSCQAFLIFSCNPILFLYWWAHGTLLLFYKFLFLKTLTLWPLKLIQYIKCPCFLTTLARFDK